MSDRSRYALLGARFLLALIFVAAGADKIAKYAATQATMQSVGIPGALLPYVIALELGGGLALLAGAFTRPVSLLLGGFCVLSAALFHNHFSDPVQAAMFMKNLAIAGGFLALFASGPGAWSLDERQR